MNKKLRRNNERGVALLFALGLLALMILLCVSFSMESLQSQKAAANNGHRSAAKVLGMSAANHAAMMIMQYQYQQRIALENNSALSDPITKDRRFLDAKDQKTLGLSVDYSAIVSHSDNTVPEDVKDDKLNKLLPQRSIYAGTQQVTTTNTYIGWYTSLNNDDTKRKPQWIYVREGSNSTDPIVGRFAYRVLPPASSTQINLAYFLRGKQDLSTAAQKQNTGLISEISQLDLTGSVFEAMRSNAGSNTKPIVGSFELLSGANNTFFYDADGKIDNKKYDAIQRVFSDGKLPADIEAFRIEKDEKVWHLHRYNISNALPSSTTLAELVDPTKNKHSLFSLDTLIVEKDKISPPNDQDILSKPFFLGMVGSKNPSSNESGSFTTMKNRRNQIAANYIDYCDIDSVPTSDSTDWKIKSPTYTGNEKTFYINELACGIKVNASVSGKQVQLAFTPTLFAELIDIYGGLDPAGYSLTGGISGISFNVSGTVTQIRNTADATDKRVVNFTLGAAEKSVVWSANDSYMTIEIFTGKPYAAGYKVGNTVTPNTGLVTFNAIPNGFEIAEFSLKITDLKITFNERLHLKNGTDADYSKLPTSELSVANSMIELKDSELNKYWVIGNMSVKDPRQNLNVKLSHSTENATGANWKFSDWVFDPKVINVDDGTSAAVGTSRGELSMLISVDATQSTQPSVTGAINPYSNPAKPRKVAAGMDGLEAVDKDNPDSDIESVEDPAAKSAKERISTAYIANKPMESFWELGMIHRGAIWETINLQRSNITPGSILSYLSTGAREIRNGYPDGSSYTQGDAYILDMVKLTTSAVSYGLFDINMLRANYPGFDYAGAGTDSHIFAEIFANLKTHSDPSNYNGGTDDDKAAELAAKIITKAKADTNEFLARSDIAEHFFKVFNEENDDTLTDARREEIIAKVMPLLKAEPALVTVFHVDIVAQTINDVGGFKVSKLDDDGNLVESSSETELGKLDYDKAKDVYFDDITGQVKMRATFDCNPYTGRIKLRQIKYLD